MVLKVRGTFDLAIIGGGIVGLALARQVSLRHPKLRLCVIEKEKELASHQSKRNSGVLHRGLYYKKGSQKSKFCIRGADLVEEYCKSKGLPIRECGKLIVATKQDDIETLHGLYNNSTANRVQGVELYSAEQVRRIQPSCTKVLEAIWSPKTSIVDWQKVAMSYANDFEKNGGTIFTDYIAGKLLPSSGYFSIVGLDKEEKNCIEAKSIVNCAGAFTDYFVRQTGNDEYPKIIPFKGNYFQLSDKLAKSINTNIYPVPNPKVPFLGVHITPRVDGTVLIGPTALLSLNYDKYSENDPLNFAQMYHVLFRSNLMKLITRRDHFKAGLMEFWRYASKERFTKEMKEFIPDITPDDLIDTGFCGIRGQGVFKDGTLVDDFFFESGLMPDFNKVLHVRNSPSPAATSSLAIAERLADVVEERCLK